MRAITNEGDFRSVIFEMRAIIYEGNYKSGKCICGEMWGICICGESTVTDEGYHK